jgi:hypothetical protein
VIPLSYCLFFVFLFFDTDVHVFIFLQLVHERVLNHLEQMRQEKYEHHYFKFFYVVQTFISVNRHKCFIVGNFSVNLNWHDCQAKIKCKVHHLIVFINHEIFGLFFGVSIFLFYWPSPFSNLVNHNVKHI